MAFQWEDKVANVYRNFNIKQITAHCEFGDD